MFYFTFNALNTRKRRTFILHSPCRARNSSQYPWVCLNTAIIMSWSSHQSVQQNYFLSIFSFPTMTGKLPILFQFLDLTQHRLPPRCSQTCIHCLFIFNLFCFVLIATTISMFCVLPTSPTVNWIISFFQPMSSVSLWNVVFPCKGGLLIILCQICDCRCSNWQPQKRKMQVKSISPWQGSGRGQCLGFCGSSSRD